MYVVVDSSVLIAAYLHRDGFTDKLLRSMFDRDYLICVSQAILEEFQKQTRELGATESEIAAYVERLLRFAVVCDETDYSPAQVQADDHIVGCYHRCQANLVVSNDKALIRRLKADGIPAVRPSTFQSYFS